MDVPLGLPKGLFPVGVPAKILKALLPSSILATWPPHLNPLDLITLTILSERYQLYISSMWSLFHSPYLHPSWAQIFASGSCFQTSNQIHYVYIRVINFLKVKSELHNEILESYRIWLCRSATCATGLSGLPSVSVLLLEPQANQVRATPNHQTLSTHAQKRRY